MLAGRNTSTIRKTTETLLEASKRVGSEKSLNKMYEKFTVKDS